MNYIKILVRGVTYMEDLVFQLRSAIKKMSERNTDYEELHLSKEECEYMLNLIKNEKVRVQDYENALKSIQHYTVDKKCAYCDQVYRYSKQALYQK